MTEALGAVVPYAFQTLGAPVLSARVFRENKASQRVLEKLGFTREGLLRRAVRCPGGQVHDDVPFSLLLGAIASATAPASTLAKACGMGSAAKPHR